MNGPLVAFTADEREMMQTLRTILEERGIHGCEVSRLLTRAFYAHQHDPQLSTGEFLARLLPEVSA